MYRVRFARKLPGDMVDMGDCVICAGNADMARDAVAAVLGFAVSHAEFEVVRVKPSLYLIGRREVHKSLSSASAQIVDASVRSTATFPGVTESLPEECWHEVSASANIRAEDQEAAIIKLSQAIMREMTGAKQKSSAREL